MVHEPEHEGAILGGGLLEGQLNGACRSPAVQPAVAIDANGLSGELLQAAWDLN